LYNVQSLISQYLLLFWFHYFMRGDANMSAVRFTGTELTSVLDAPPTRDANKAMDESQRLFHTQA
jgi:glycine betaine/choline ABC-type transport system substrate-binding protein